jgi:hypothetical protein
MTKVLIAVALTGVALVAVQDAQARSRYHTAPRCVPTVTGSGRTILVCGGGQGGVYNPVTCRKVYNAYTRRFQVVC